MTDNPEERIDQDDRTDRYARPGQDGHPDRDEQLDWDGHPDRDDGSTASAERHDRDVDGADSSFVFPAADASMRGDAPLAELAEELRQRRSGEPAVDDAFAEVDVGEIDTDALWERVLSADDPAVDPDETDVRIVPKRSYCERCEHFSSPPTVACAHDGTEILELVGTDQFKVIDCPVVRENERLGRIPE